MHCDRKTGGRAPKRPRPRPRSQPKESESLCALACKRFYEERSCTRCRRQHGSEGVDRDFIRRGEDQLRAMANMKWSISDVHPNYDGTTTMSLGLGKDYIAVSIHVRKVPWDGWLCPLFVCVLEGGAGARRWSRDSTDDKMSIRDFSNDAPWERWSKEKFSRMEGGRLQGEWRSAGLGRVQVRALVSRGRRLDQIDVGRGAGVRGKLKAVLAHRGEHPLRKRRCASAGTASLRALGRVWLNRRRFCSAEERNLGVEDV